MKFDLKNSLPLSALFLMSQSSESKTIPMLDSKENDMEFRVDESTAQLLSEVPTILDERMLALAKSERQKKIDALNTIPWFDAQLRKADVHKAMERSYEVGCAQSLIQNELEMRGYPSFWISSLMSQGAPKRMGQLKEMYSRRDSTKWVNNNKGASAKPQKPADLPKGVGHEEPRIWRIPFQRPPFPVPKPVALPNGKTWTHQIAAFQMWVWTVCWKLKDQLDPDDPLHVITGSEACYILYTSTTLSCSFKEYKRLLADSRVYIASYANKPKKNSNKSVSLFRVNKDRPVFHIGKGVITTYKDLFKYADNFKKHKNLARLLAKAFSEDENERKSVDYARLDALCRKVFPADYVPSELVCKFEMKSVTTDSGEPRNRKERRAELSRSRSADRERESEEIKQEKIRRLKEFEDRKNRIENSFKQATLNAKEHIRRQEEEDLKRFVSEQIAKEDPDKKRIDEALKKAAREQPSIERAFRVAQVDEDARRLAFETELRALQDFCNSSDFNYNDVEYLRAKFDRVFEGNNYSFDHKVTLPSKVEVETFVVGTANSFGVDLGSSFIDHLARLFFLLFGLSNNDNWQSAMSTLGLYAMSNPRVWARVKDSFYGIIDARFEAKDGKVASGPDLVETGERDKSFGENLRDRFYQSAIYVGVISVVVEFFGNISDYVCGAIYPLITATKFAVTRDVASALSVRIIERITDIVSRIKKCYDVGSLTPLWGENYDTAGFVEETEAMIMYTPYMLAVNKANVGAMEQLQMLREDGKIKAFWTCPVALPVYVERADIVIERGKVMIEYFKSNEKLCAMLNKQLDKFVKHVERIKLQNSKSRLRMAPMFIYVHGGPGVGKSTMCAALEQAFANKYGWDYSGGLYNWQKNVNFQTGLNQSTVIVDYDDIDTTVAPVQAGVPNHIESYMAMVNNNPFPVEESESQLKGTSVATPLLAVAKSNFIDGRVTEFSREPLAFFRRINVHATFKPKVEFATKGSSPQLDKKKLGSSLTHDVVDVEVRVFDPSMWKEGEYNFPFSKAVTMSFSQFTSFCLEMMDEHFKQQDKLIRAASDEGDFCPNCYLAKVKNCGCTMMKSFVVEEAMRKKAKEVIKGKYKEDLAKYLVNTLNDVRETSEAEATLVPLKDGDDVKIKIGDKEFVILPTDMTFEAMQNVSLNPILYFKNLMIAAKDWFRSKIDLLSDYIIYLSSPTLARSIARETLKVSGYILATIGVAYAAIKSFIKLCHRSKEIYLLAFEARENNRAGAPIKEWAQAEQSYKPGIPPPSFNATWTKDELVTAIRSAYVEVHRGDFSLLGVLISHNILAVPAHILPGEELDVRVPIPEMHLTVVIDGQILQIPVSKANCRRLATNSNIILIKCGTLKPTSALTNKFWKVRDEGVQQFDELEMIMPSSVKGCTTHNMISIVGETCIMSDFMTKEGDCGGLAIARLNGSWRIVGMHYMGMTAKGSVQKNSLAAVLTGQELEHIAKTIGGVFQAVCSPRMFFTKAELPPTCTKYPMMSEVNTARKDWGAMPWCLGTLDPPLSGSTMKTRLKWSLAKEKFNPLIVRWCDGIENYWRLPTFKGYMNAEDKWKSWYTNAFATQNKSVARPEILCCALYDYLLGMDELLREGYREISEQEAIVGVPGSVINPMKLSTSFGPPYSTSKHAHIYVNEDRVAYLSPEAYTMCEEFDRIVDEGYIPGVLGVVFPKDEGLKITKEFGRLFTVLPGVANLKYKQQFSAMKAFLRSNKEFFGSCVGINMTSAEINNIVNALRAIDPELARIIDADIKAMDKSYNGDVFDIICLCIYAIVFFLGGDAFRAFVCAQSIKVTITSVKNDLIITFWNPSGNDITVEINCIGNQLTFRYVYYNHRYKTQNDVPSCVYEWYANFFKAPIPVVPLQYNFRADVCLRTFGDDSIQSRKKGVDLEPDLEKVCHEHLGFILTPGNKKDSEICFGTLSDVVFLKRKFVYDEELKMYIPPLDKRSLARMLTIKKDSSFSDRDHVCISLSECVRELAYHPREEYEEFMKIAREFIVEQKLELNPYLRLKDYDEMREMIRLGTYQTWEDRVKVPLREVDGLSVTEDYERVFEMADSKKDNGSNDGLSGENVNNYASVSDAKAKNVDLGAYESTIPLVDTGKTKGKLKVVAVPPLELGDYLNRYVKISNVTVQNSDANLSQVTVIDPWLNMLSLARVREKLNGFAFMRSGLDILVVPAVPGNAQGLYALTAVPQGYAYTPLVAQENPLDIPTPHQCFNTDIYATLDIAASTAYSFSLPWCLPTDYTSVAEGGIGSWMLYFFCITGVQSGIPSGLTTGSYTIYARMSDDLQLAGGRFEMKSSGEKMSSKVKKAGNLASMFSSVPMVNQFAAPAAAILDSTANLMSMFGYTRDNEIPKNERTALRGVSNVINVDGNDFGDVSALSSLNCISNEPSHNSENTAEDELSFAKVFDRWTAISQFQWTPALTPQTVLVDIPVAPLFCIGIPDLFRVGTAGFVGIPFRYWRGTMHFRVFISCSALHRGTIQVVWFPNNGSTSNPVDPVSILFNKIIDIQGSAVFDFSIGPGNFNFWYENEIMYSALSGNSLNAKNGTLRLLVVNPLKAPNTGSTVWCTVFSKGGSDMQFAVPRDGMRMPLGTNVLSTSRTFQQNMWFESKKGALIELDTSRYDRYFEGAREDKEEATGEEVESFVLVPSVPPIDAEVMMGEDIRSIRALVQKPCRIALPATLAGFISQNYGRIMPYNAATSSEWTMASHYRVLFMALAGSEKYKIQMFVAPNTVWLSMGARSTVTTQPVNPMLNTVYPMSYDNAAEITIPFYGIQRFVNGYRNITDADEALRKSTFALFNNTGTFPAAVPVWCVAWYSFGSDVRLSHFRFTPKVRVTGVAPAAPTRFL